MTWEETIKFIRTQSEYRELVEKSYFEENLTLNIDRFKNSEEFEETLSIIRDIIPFSGSILDVGSGNGISAISFALEGYNVTVSEPDSSDTIGAGAIRKLRKHYNLSKMDIYEEFAEDIHIENNVGFDMVYLRQAMHHANDLKKFISNLYSLIKPNGFLLTVRDHVIYNQEDKEWFLEMHPLHKFYGGENAYTFQEYKDAFESAGFTVIKVLKHFDSVINYFPITKNEFEEKIRQNESQLEDHLVNKLGIIGKLSLVKFLYKKKVGFNPKKVWDEGSVPGRMYTFIAQRK